MIIATKPEARFIFSTRGWFVIGFTIACAAVWAGIIWATIKFGWGLPVLLILAVFALLAIEMLSGRKLIGNAPDGE